MPGVAERVFQLAEEVALTSGCEVVDVEYVKEGREWVLRLSVDHPAGVDLGLCATLSNELSGVLDLQEVVPGAYRLEVSSPGLTRPLRKREEYSRFSGRLAVLRTFRPLEGDATGRKAFRGVLRGVDGHDILMDMDGQAGQTPNVRIPFDLISKANLEVDF
ncbi:MAG: ribosome maturation factor RimP [Magnetococcales bacterium]|nr:ribosome maturation factor RimP [Magnetococcales bacterium]